MEAFHIIMALVALAVALAVVGRLIVNRYPPGPEPKDTNKRDEVLAMLRARPRVTDPGERARLRAEKNARIREENAKNREEIHARMRANKQ